MSSYKIYVRVRIFNFKNKNIMKKIVSLKFLIILCLLTSLAGCTTNQLAPVEDGYRSPPTKKGAYRVKAGDTLYSIAWAFGNDYRELAQRNGISAPAYNIRTGQLIHINPDRHHHHTKHALPHTAKPATVKSTVFNEPTPIKVTIQRTVIVKKSEVKPAPIIAKQPIATFRSVLGSVKHWNWPAQGKVIRGYSPTGGYKGIDIAGTRGSAVLATADGKVVYSGRGLRGYGELVIIKHNEEYLSAYAHNSALLVKEGDSVRAGQEIAKMGNTDANQVMLHFEIRRAGKPVNPMDYLARK
ncbi:peptidoglycan DD-metalloendopeptidase family protein [soil metagenome]